MSHFLFGVIESSKVPGRQIIEKGIDVCWGAQLQQPTVLEMLNLRAARATSIETPFAITLVGDDNADGLISPYQVERDAIVGNLNTVLAWLDRERTGRNAELWMTEGFDDSFRELRGSRQELFERAKEVLLQSVDVPSLRLRFQ